MRLISTLCCLYCWFLEHWISIPWIFSDVLFLYHLCWFLGNDDFSNVTWPNTHSCHTHECCGCCPLNFTRCSFSDSRTIKPCTVGCIILFHGLFFLQSCHDQRSAGTWIQYLTQYQLLCLTMASSTKLDPWPVLSQSAKPKRVRTTDSATLTLSTYTHPQPFS